MFLHIRLIRVGSCNGIALNNLDKAGNCLRTGNEIVLVFIGKRILEGEPGVSGRGTSPGSVFRRGRNEKSCQLLSQRNYTSEYLNATAQVNDSWADLGPRSA